MMKIRTLIVDDEPLARLNLASLLALEADFEVVAECADAPSAITATPCDCTCDPSPA